MAEGRAHHRGAETCPGRLPKSSRSHPQGPHQSRRRRRPPRGRARGGPLERPRNRDHGDWSSNVAISWPSRRYAPRDIADQLAEGLADVPASPAPRSRARASSTSASTPPPRARSRETSSRPARHYGHGDSRGRARHQPRVRVGEPDRPAAHRAHPLGGARRLDGRGAAAAGATSRPSTTSTTPAARWTSSRLGARRGQGRADPRGRLPGRLHRRPRGAGARARSGAARAPDDEALHTARESRTAAARRRSGLARRFNVASTCGSPRPTLHEPRRRRAGRRAPARTGPRLRRGRCRLGAHDRLR